MLDLLIIGAGPAGLSAAVYAQRAALHACTLERNGAGGQIADAVHVENYPGFSQISGYDLAQAMHAHAQSLGAVFEAAEVSGLIRRKSHWDVLCADGKTVSARAVIAATGTQRRKLQVTGEDTYTGHGVSYCATCDGFFFKDKTVAVIGGGDTAVEDAIYLSELARHVYLIHRRDTLRANRRRQALVRTKQNITFLWKTVVKEICGDGQQVRSITVDTDGTCGQVPVDGVFVAVGAVPDGGYLPPEITRDAAGYVQAGEDGITNLPGLFVAGDLRTKTLRQAVTAAADGACCVAAAEQYLREQ